MLVYATHISLPFGHITIVYVIAFVMLLQVVCCNQRLPYMSLLCLDNLVSSWLREYKKRQWKIYPTKRTLNDIE